MTGIEEALRYLEARGYLANSNGAHPEGTEERWELLTLEAALAEREPLQQVITGFVRPGLVVVYGAPGTLKSMLLADLAICVASGKAWLQPAPGEGCTAIPVQQCPVLWIDFDNGERRTLDRFAALARGHSVATAPLGIYAMPTPRLNASAPDSIASAARRIKEFEAGLVIVDNLGLIAGTDENSADMATAMGNLRWLAEETNACIVLIHHQRKSNGVVARAGESLRGHSSIEAALDLALLVERENSGNFINLKATKSRDVLVRPFAAQFSYEHKAGTTELRAARFFGATPALEAEERERMELEQRLDAAILAAANGLSQRKLIDAVRHVVPTAGEKRILQRIEALQQAGRLRVQQAARGALAYYKA